MYGFDEPLSSGRARMSDKAEGRIRIGSAKLGQERTRGSHPAPKMRDRDNDAWPDDGPRRPTRGHPVLVVSAPDFAIQFRPCLADMPAPPGTDLETVVVQAFKDALAANADVRYRCSDDTGRIGIWTRPSGSPAVDSARDRGLAAIDAVNDDEQFAMWISANYVRGLAHTAWNDAPKRIDHDGNPADDGPIHLTGLDVAFTSPDKVVTTVTGYDESTWPAVDFTLTVTDRIVTSAFQIQVLSETQLQTDPTWFNVLAAVFGVLGFVLNPIFIIPALGFAAESVIVSSIDPHVDQAGAGAAVAKNLPKEVMVSGGRKLEPVYRRVDVNAGGLTAGGDVLILTRSPSVTIDAQPRVSVPSGASTVTRSFRAVTTDLRGRLTFAWTADGTAGPSNARSTNVTFSTGGVTRTHPVNKLVHVGITDRDGLTATASLSVQLFTTRDADGDPPVCRVRPWLPQCQ